MAFGGTAITVFVPEFLDFPSRFSFWLPPTTYLLLLTAEDTFIRPNNPEYLRLVYNAGFKSTKKMSMW